MDVKQKRNFLKAFRKNKIKQEYLMEKIMSIDEVMLGVKSRPFDKLPGGTTISKEELLTQKTELEMRLDSLKRNGKEIKKTIASLIYSLEKPNHCEVLNLYFLECLEFKEIAEKIGYSERHVVRMYTEAVNLIEL